MSSVVLPYIYASPAHLEALQLSLRTGVKWKAYWVVVVVSYFHLKSFLKMAEAAFWIHPRLLISSSSEDVPRPFTLPPAPPPLPPPSPPPPPPPAAPAFGHLERRWRMRRMTATRTSSTRWSRRADTSRNSQRFFAANRFPSAALKNTDRGHSLYNNY